MDKYQNNDNNEIYIIDDVNEIGDYQDDGKKNLIIGGILFGVTCLSCFATIKHAINVLETSHTTRSLEAMISGASFLIPIGLFSGSVAEIIVGLYKKFKKKKSIKKLTLTKN